MGEANTDLVPNVKNAIDAIIARENFTSPPTIDVAPGSQLGDGFTSKTYAIFIKGGGRTIDLFVKYLPENSTNAMADNFKQAFYTEFRFYEKIFPAMLQFQREKDLIEGDIFDHVPKYYKTEIKYEGVPVIVMENLKSSGYTLRNFNEPIDDDHLTLTLKTLAKYHAISFAMKDQNPDLFKQLSGDIKDYYVENFKSSGFANILGGMVDGFLGSLNPVTDKNLVNGCRNLPETLSEHVSTLDKQVDDYAVICQGDCWSNNTMFQYDEKTGTPVNIKLVDWQVQRYNSPVLDIAFVFYTAATKYTLANFDRYLKMYYDTLADSIKKLGSEPRKVYPRVVFMNHWKKYAKFGLGASFGAYMLQLAKKEQTPDLLEDQDAIPVVTGSFEGEGEYYAKIKLLVEHFVERDFL